MARHSSIFSKVTRCPTESVMVKPSNGGRSQPDRPADGSALPKSGGRSPRVATGRWSNHPIGRLLDRFAGFLGHGVPRIGGKLSGECNVLAPVGARGSNQVWLGGVGVL